MAKSKNNSDKISKSLTDNQIETFLSVNDLDAKSLRLFRSIDSVFLDEYEKFVKGISDAALPLVLIRVIRNERFRGFYIFYENGSVEKHNMADPDFEKMSAIGHIPLTVSLLSLPYVYGTDAIKEEQNIIDKFSNLLHRCAVMNDLLVSNPGMMSKKQINHAQVILKETTSFLQGIMHAGVIKSSELKTYLDTVRPDVLQLLLQANQMVNATVAKFVQYLKPRMGKKAWDKMYVVLQTNKGMLEHNVLADAFVSHMEKEKLKTNYVMMTNTSMTADEIREKYMGTIIGDRLMKEIVMGVDFAKLTEGIGGSANSAGTFAKS
jgi:hypothetical protein